MRYGMKARLAALAAFVLLAFCAQYSGAAEIPKDRPLTIDEAVGMAVGTHPRIKGAEQDLEAGKYSTRVAISAFWPQASFEASRNWVHSERVTRIGGVSATTSAVYIANNFSFNTNWTLFDFGRTYFGVRSLAKLEDSLTNDLSTTQQQVAYDVMNAYFALLRAQSLVKVSQETLDAANQHLKQAQAFFEVGVKPKFDVTSAEVQVNTAKVGLIQANDAVRSARMVLNTKISVDPRTPTEVAEVAVLDEMSKDMDGYYQEALKNRPEIRSLEAKVESSKMSVKAAAADWLPSISATAVANWYKENHSQAFPNDNVQLTLDVPIFNGFATLAAVGKARAGVLSTQYKLDDLKLTVLSDVSLSYIAVEDAKARFAALESSVQKAKENLDIAQGRYEAGVGPIIDVTDAQVSLTQAETDYTTAKYDYHTAYTNLLKSVGKGVK